MTGYQNKSLDLDEAGFTTYSQHIVAEIAKQFRKKLALEPFPVIEMAGKMEEIIHGQVLQDFGCPVVHGRREVFHAYQTRCENLVRNAAIRELNWRSLFDRSDYNAVYVGLTEENYRPPAPRVEGRGRGRPPGSGRGGRGGVGGRPPKAKKSGKDSSSDGDYEDDDDASDDDFKIERTQRKKRNQSTASSYAYDDEY